VPKTENPPPKQQGTRKKAKRPATNLWFINAEIENKRKPQVGGQADLAKSLDILSMEYIYI